MTQDISAEQLRALRLAAGLEPSALARQVSLSTAQLLQLEGDQDSLFYTPAIRRQAARKVYFHLTGHWPVDSEPALPPPDDQAPQNANPGPDLQALHAMPAAESVAALTPAPTQPTGGRWAARPVLVSSVMLAGLALSGWLAAGRPLPQTTQAVDLAARLPASASPATSAVLTPDPSAQPDPARASAGPVKGQPVTSPVRSDQDLVAMSPSSGPPVAPALRAESAYPAPCPDPAEPAVALQLPPAEAPAVRLVSNVTQWVCVTDGAGRSSQHRLAAGQGTLLSGSAPWLVHAGSLRQAQIYVQGIRLAWPAEMSNRVQLLSPQ